MILELHIVQNFAPSNLNRSDTGAPKDCTFGGFRRARISSQCFKRAMREHFRAHFVGQNNLAERSTRLVEAVAARLEASGKDKVQARRAIEAALGGIGLKMSAKDPAKTQYLLFLGRAEIDNIADVCAAHYDQLLAAAPPEKLKAEGDAKDAKEAKSAKAAKRESKDVVPPEIQKALLRILDGGKAADLALFGRMLADLPDKNRDAAAQVAHAISTHKTGVEFDFYTAVDDLKPEDTAGADMLGTVEFNSACFYRYLNVDTDELTKNLQNDAELTRATIQAFLRAAVEAMPTGKQNSFATHEKPSLVFAVVRDNARCSLANAFVKPVKPSERIEKNGAAREGLVLNSIERLDREWQAVHEVFGDNAKSKVFVTTERAAEIRNLGDQATTFDELIEKTLGAIYNGQEV